jgi:VWFA-related protein
MKFQSAAFFGALLFLMAGSAKAQQSAPANSGTIIQTETKVVLVDAVVTDKKGNYVHDLTAKDFRVWEDNKEQTVSSFSFEGGTASSAQRHYVVLFFDNSNMDLTDQPRARAAAVKFVQANAGPNQMMSVVNFGGTLQVAQNFTQDADRLTSIVSGAKTPALVADAAASDASLQLNIAAANFGARSMLLAVRDLARNLSRIPGRKTLILLSAGFKLRPDEQSAELNAAIDACNHANVAIYAVDVRGLVAGDTPAKAAGITPGNRAPGVRSFLQPAAFVSGERPRLMPAAWQRGPVGGSIGGGGAPGGWSDPRNQAHLEMPKLPESLFTNQEVLLVLASGTGGFVIKNTNDLAGGLQKIGKEQDEYYLLGYTPPDSADGACHTLRVKVNRGGTTVRSRAGYCNARTNNVLAGSPVEKELESRVAASQPGGLPASMEVPFFYTGPNVARVNLAMEMKLDELKVEKQKGKLHADINVLGLAYRPDGSVGARFSDTLKLDFDDAKRMEAFTAKPIHYENQFDLAPGSYTLKVAFSSGGKDFGKAEVPLSITPYDPKQFSLSGLALSREWSPVAAVRGTVEAMLLADRTPLIAEGARFVPAGSNRFKKTDPAALYAEIYEPLLMAPDQPNPFGIGMGLRILDAKTGEQKLDTGVLRVNVPMKTGNPVVPLALKVPLESLAPGSYTLELEVGDTAGKTSKRTTAIEVE